MNTSPLPKRASILFYCQYYSSFGPQSRSLQIGKELVRSFNVDYLLGKPGEDPDFSTEIDSEHFQRLLLPSYGDVVKRLPTSIVGDKMMDRKEALKQFLAGRHYDCFLITVFPFGKAYLLPEIIFILDIIKQINPACRTVCVMRDAADKGSLDHASMIKSIVDNYIDAIIVHADPSILRLEDSIPFVKAFENKIFYSGFIPNACEAEHPAKREKKILVSMGSGGMGEELAYAVTEVLDCFADYHVTFDYGPRATTQLIEHLNQIEKKRGDRVEVASFFRDFETKLRECALSISTGGSSLIDVVYTGTSGLAYPSFFWDQLARSKKFSDYKLIKMLSASDLKPQKMTRLIQEGLENTPPPIDIRMDGAIQTCRFLEQFLQTPHSPGA